MKTSWKGEFGYELVGVVPYAYWLAQRGELEATEAMGDTKPLYYFSPDHTELPGNRLSLTLKGFPLKTPHEQTLDKSKWLPPPYKKVYKNDRFVFDKPLCIVANKYSIQWKRPKPVNYIPYSTLNEIFNRLSTTYQIVYVRPEPKDIVEDRNPMQDMHEFGSIRKHHKSVILIQDLHEQNRDLTFNELQFMLFANSEKFISTQGGYSVLASYFGGTNLIYAEMGSEITKNAYSWYHEFSGAKINVARTYTELLQKLIL